MKCTIVTSVDIFQSGKNFHYSLFIAHLCIEKLLKAFVTKNTKQIPPKTHNLLRLADLADLELDDEKISFFEQLNQFQMDTRYPDEKFELYKMATKEFTADRIKKLKEIHVWLISKI
ncbi:MAG: HEPN domain-containing protein [Melioribacteraceae bacterium]|nr:HEPN domain-containing protein [Melioribacteraceae bacterium]